MKDPHDNVVKFRPRPPAPPKPKAKPKPKAFQANRYADGGTEPAIRWNKAPKAAVIIVLILVAMMLVSALADGVSRIGMG